MNAHNLADELDDIDAYEKHQTLLGKASDMLRHQADYIKHLEEGLESALALNKAQAERAINNEPRQG
jgi:hypothetical protein